MDSVIAAAARALRAGDPLGALKRVALREDPAGVALRGIAMAQLGDLPRARKLLRRASRDFGPREALERARCLTAEAEVALAARDLGWPARALAEALRAFAAHGDRENAAHVRLLQIRRLLLLGRVAEAEGAWALLDLAGSARLQASGALVGASAPATWMAGVSSRPYEGVSPSDMTATLLELNGAPGIVFHGAGRVIGTLTLVLDETGRIATIHNIANPDKLADVTRRSVHLLESP